MRRPVTSPGATRIQCALSSSAQNRSGRSAARFTSSGAVNSEARTSGSVSTVLAGRTLTAPKKFRLPGWATYRCERHPAEHLQLRVPTSGRSSGVAEPPAGAGSCGNVVKRRRRLALPTTDRELAAMAAAAMIGDRSQPVKG